MPIQKQKILVLTSTFPRWKNDTDPPFVYELCKRLEKDFEIHVLAPHFPNSKKSEKIDNIQITRFTYFFSRFEKLAYDGGILPNLKNKPELTFLIPFFIISQTYSIIKLNRKHRFSAIHAHWIIPQGLSLYLSQYFLNFKGIKVITSHGGDLFSIKGSVFTFIKSRILNYFDKVTVVSKIMKNEIEKWKIIRAKVYVAPMGVDLHGRFSPPETRTNRSGILFVGRIVEKKGLKYLIQAMPSILKQQPDVTLTIIGDGPLKPSLVDLSEKLKISDSIKFLGAIPNNEISNYYKKTQITVVPSIITKSGDQEGLGLTIVEAMGCGSPVVASNIPAIHDVVVDKKNGLLAEQKSPHDLAEKINCLLNNKDLSISLAIEGRNSCLRHFDWKSVGRNYVELLSSLET